MCGAIVAILAGLAGEASAEQVLDSTIRQVVLPDFDRGTRAVLDARSGNLSDAPATSKYHTEDELFELLRESGDVVYDNGAVLGVAAGRSAVFDHLPDSAGTGFAWVDALTSVRKISNPFPPRGSYVLFATRDGGIALMKLLDRDNAGLHVAYLYDAQGAGFSDEGVRALRELPIGDAGVVSKGTSELTPVGSAPAIAWDFDRNQAEELPVWEGSESGLADYLDRVRSSSDADVAFTNTLVPTLQFAAPKILPLGSGRASAWANRDLTRRLKPMPGKGAIRANEGALLLIETASGGYAAIRVNVVESNRVIFAWLFRAKGPAKFENLDWLDTSYFAAQSGKSQAEKDRQLFQAIAERDRMAIQTALAVGADPNAKNASTGFPVLVAAATEKDVGIVETLIAAGADPDSVSAGGWTALHVAAKLGDYDMAVALLAHGADASRRASDGATPLQLAATSPDADEKLITLLRARGGAPKSLREAVLVGDKVSVEKLLSDPASLSAASEKAEGGKTLLHLAAENGRASVLADLVRAGFDPESRDSRGLTPLELAAWHGKEEAIAELMQLGGEDAAKRATGALVASVTAGYLDAARVLLEAGVARQERAGAYSAEEIAYRFGSEEMVDLFQEVQPTGLPEWALARLGRAKQLAEQIDRSGMDSSLSPDGRTALGLAAAEGKADCVDVLLAHGVNPNAVDATYERRTALHYAAAEGNLESVKALLRKGADPNVPNRYGQSPLVEAAVSQHADVVEALLQAGADKSQLPDWYSNDSPVGR